MSMKLVPSNEKISIKWFVYAGDEKIRCNKTMRGSWGYDAECSCGWKTMSGGALRSSVKWAVESHKIFDHGYKWHNSNDEIGYEEFAQKETYCEQCDNGTDTPCTACLWEESVK